MHDIKHLVFLKMQNSNYSIYQQLIDTCKSPECHSSQDKWSYLASFGKHNQMVFALALLWFGRPTTEPHVVVLVR